MDASPSSNFNILLQQERRRSNWHQQDLADELETTIATIEREERGYQQSSAYFRIELCTL